MQRLDGACLRNGFLSVDRIRRMFVRTLAAVVFGLGSLMSSQSLAAEKQDTLAGDTWQTRDAQLRERGERRRYAGDALEHIAVPMGGIGAGQVHITGRGRLEQWQIINNFNSDASAPDSFFAVWTKDGQGNVVAKRLQDGPEGPLPATAAVEFSGEYPFAWLRYLDQELPVQTSLEVYSPFIPLNAKDSGLPVAVFRFSLRNIAETPIEAALMAATPNLIGWDGYAALDGARYRDYLGNENRWAAGERAQVIQMQTRAGNAHRLSKSCGLFTNDGDVAYSMRLCGNLNVYYDKAVSPPKEMTSTILWAGALSNQDPRFGLPELLKSVEDGVVLIIAGVGETLLTIADRAFDPPQDLITFEDWESGTYDGWSIEGGAFGERPMDGPSRTHFMAGTLAQGDPAAGRAESKPFTISKRFLHLLAGGGNHPGKECVNLRIGGTVIASATGDDSLRLRPVCWDVSEYLGKEAVIEIVDAFSSDWGLILADDIVFSDSPRSPFVSRETAAQWREAMPFEWKAMNRVDGATAVNRGSAVLNGISQQEITAASRWALSGFALKPGARVLLQTQDGAPLIIEGPCGKGKIIACLGPVHQWLSDYDQKMLIGNLVALAADAAYTAPTGGDEASPFYGSMALAALTAEGTVSALPQWDDLDVLWQDFAGDGRFDLSTSGVGPSLPGRTWNGALSVPVVLAPGEEKQITFLLAWHFPNRMRDWRYGLGPPPPQFDFRLGNQYNNWFRDAAEVVDYVAANFERLDQETRAFHRAFYDSTLPHWLLDAVTANVSSIRSPILMWLEDGTVAGFEGSNASCPMNCTHVYNYAMSIAFLFPELERNVRETDLLRQMNPDEHFIPHRTLLPLSLPRLGNQNLGPVHHALDGELGTILKTYREWRQCGGRDWLATLWPNAKKVMQHVLRDHDVDGDGVIKGEQPNTYDAHAYGSNTFIGTLYLAALRAAEEMAKEFADEEFAALCRDRFEKGRTGYDQTCWNGEYYRNVFDAPGATAETYEDYNCWGPGCLSDQLVGQWWAHILGLGYMLPPERVGQALDAIHKYNGRRSLTEHRHTQRIFAGENESGLLNCTWPMGGRPKKPIRYCDEVWTGIEYEVAAALLYEGRVREGLQIAKAARDRYTGNQRNPWCEIEYGGHYARAMSSYSLLLAATGFDFNAAAARLSYSPRLSPDDFKAFFSTGRCWGSLAQQRGNREQTNTVSVDYGQLELRELEIELASAEDVPPQVVLDAPRNSQIRQVVVNGKKCLLTFEDPILLRAGERIEVRLRNGGN